MNVINKLLVFLDTGFLKEYKPRDSAYTDLFEYAKNDRIILCASHISIEEWRTQKLSHAKNFVDTTRGNLGNLLGSNPFAHRTLSECFVGDFLGDGWLRAQSLTYVQEFVRDNKIKVYDPDKKHMDATWSSYFDGQTPFEKVKSRKDIPDAWIFEAARDAMQDNVRLHRKYCIGSDQNLCSALEGIGFTRITLVDLLALLKHPTIVEQAENANYQAILDDLPQLTDDNEATELDKVLASAINQDVKAIYIRLLGYAHWLSGHTKSEIQAAIIAQGYEVKLIDACMAILSQDSLQLIKDTGNHILPINSTACKDAANRIMPEILDFLDKD